MTGKSESDFQVHLIGPGVVFVLTNKKKLA